MSLMPDDSGWLPMDSAPRDGTPILGWCVHEADPYWEVMGQRLTIYGAHAEGLSHVSNGPHVLEWGGGWDDRSYEDSNASWLPDWWFRADSEFEVAANPVLWKPIAPPKCDHNFVDARNEFIEDGEICLKCGALRPGNQEKS